MNRPIVLLLPQGSLYRDLFPDPVRKSLEAFAEVRNDPDGERWTAESFHHAIGEAEGVITGWGSPRIDGAALDAAPRLRIVGHAAGTIKAIGSPELFERGITVVNAHSSIAPYVGEMALGLTLAGLRQFAAHDRALRIERKWKASPIPERTLRGKSVGLVGFGHTAREFAKLLPPFGCRIRAADPYVSPETAASFGVELASLREVLQTSEILSLHAASLPETYHLLGKEELALLPDGALLVNTARGQLIDPDALTQELQSGRIQAALDVTEPEPLPAEHPWRDLPNVFVTPHISGPTPDRRWDMAAMIVDDMRRFFEGEPILHPAHPAGLYMD